MPQPTAKPVKKASKAAESSTTKVRNSPETQATSDPHLLEVEQLRDAYREAGTAGVRRKIRELYPNHRGIRNKPL